MRATLRRMLRAPAISTDSAAPAELAPSLVALFAAGAGLSAASLYYNQPILGAMAKELHATPRQIGLVPMLTQLGYATGILLFAPLGDRLDRRLVIVAKLIALTVVLTLAGVSPSVGLLAAASLALGLLATTAQDFVPAAAALAPPAARGKVVGSVMTGLLLGILLSRLVSGAVSDHFGWRTVYFGAAATIAVLALVSALRLPQIAPTATESYGVLLRSMVVMARDIPALRRATLSQTLLSVAFSAFWSTLALALGAPPFHLGSTAARSRLNAVLVSSMFLGMSIGAALASQVLVRFGWSAVMTLGAIAAALALVVRLLPTHA